ncbi:MAG: hypothetical protein ACFB2W_21945 [Leptolyngbyaceae cyanobacterium]
MELCPCCGVRLLRHASKAGSYLRCGSCRFEIPEELPVDADASNTTDGLLDESDGAKAAVAE